MTPGNVTPVTDSHSLEARASRALMTTYARYPIELVSGTGARVTDSAGREYLDFIAGIAVSSLGHAHPAVVGAIRDASAGLLHVSNLYWTEPMVRLAERLTELSSMDRAFFCNSGAEAIEAALKLARKARPGRTDFVVFERSFHGRTMGALSATSQPHYQEAFKPLVPGFHAVPYGDIDAVRSAVSASTAGILVEVVQGEGGVRPAPAGFLAELRAICDESGALLLLDEVQTGMGRTGTLFAFQGEDVLPDVIATAKALAGGLPMGAMLARGACATAFVPGDHASTFGGGPFVSTVALAVLETIATPEFLAEVRRKADVLAAGLDGIAARRACVVESRGRGMLRGLQLTGPRAPELVALLHEQGLLAAPAGKDVLRMTPPLIVTDDEIRRALSLLDEALARMER